MPFHNLTGIMWQIYGRQITALINERTFVNKNVFVQSWADSKPWLWQTYLHCFLQQAPCAECSPGKRSLQFTLENNGMLHQQRVVWCTHKFSETLPAARHFISLWSMKLNNPRLCNQITFHSVSLLCSPHKRVETVLKWWKMTAKGWPVRANTLILVAWSGRRVACFAINLTDGDVRQNPWVGYAGCLNTRGLVSWKWCAVRRPE